MPGRLHVDHEVRDAPVLRRSSRVGAGQADPPAGDCAYDVHTFWPVSSQPPSTGVGPRRQRREIAAGAGLAEQLAPELAGVEDRGSHRAFCSSVPCASSVGPARLMPDTVDRLRRTRCARTRRCRSPPRPASRSARRTRVGQWMPTQRSRGQLRLPRPSPRDLVVDAMRSTGGGSRFASQPGPDLGRERLLVGRERQVHLRGPRTARGRPRRARRAARPRRRRRTAGRPPRRDHAIHRSSPPHRSRRNFWCTSVRFTILFVPVVGKSRTMRT